MSKLEILNSRQKSLTEQLNEHKDMIINDWLKNQERATIKIGAEFDVKKAKEMKLFNNQVARLNELKLDISKTNPEWLVKIIDFSNSLDNSITSTA